MAAKALSFRVIDLQTGQYPNLECIALNEDWAKDLAYCDMDGFLINEDGMLCLADETGKYIYCPHDRFKIIYTTKTSHSFIY